MKMLQTRQCLAMLGSVLPLLVLPTISIAAKAPHTTVFSDVSKLYKREKLADGSFRPETYAIGKGVFINNNKDDESLTTLSIREMGGLLEPALAEADYYPTESPEATDLLIVVSWGKTTPMYDELMHDWAVEEISRHINQEMLWMDTGGGFDAGQSIGAGGEAMHSFGANVGMNRWGSLHANKYNAALLGYEENIDRISGRPLHFQSELTEFAYELNQQRYFVVLQAYDFQEMWKHKKQKLLWVNRLSIRAKKHRFDEQFQNMVLAASRYYGQRDGAFRRYQTPARVIMKDLEFLGVEK